MKLISRTVGELDVLQHPKEEMSKFLVKKKKKKKKP